MRENLAVLNEGEKQQDCCAKGNDRGAVFETGRTWVLTSKTVQKSFRMDSPNCCNGTGVPSLPIPIPPPLAQPPSPDGCTGESDKGHEQQERAGEARREDQRACPVGVSGCLIFTLSDLYVKPRTPGLPAAQLVTNTTWLLPPSGHPPAHQLAATATTCSYNNHAA